MGCKGYASSASSFLPLFSPNTVQGYNLAAGNHSAMAPWLTRLIRKWAIPSTHFLLFPIIFGPFPPSLSPSAHRNHRVGGTAERAIMGHWRQFSVTWRPFMPPKVRFSCHIARSLLEHHHSGPVLVLPSTIPALSSICTPKGGEPNR